MKIIKNTAIFLSLCLIFAGGILTVEPEMTYAAVSWEQKGASIFPLYDTHLSNSETQQSLRNLKATGANYVSFIIPLKQGDRWSSWVYNAHNTPTDESLAAAIDFAHSIGLKVMLKPHLETEQGEWRANINPTNREEWFASYGDSLERIARIAQAHGVEDFSLGTEMINVSTPDSNPTNTQNWYALIARIRGVFTGQLSYCANRQDEVEKIEFWDKLDYISLSAYYEMWNSDGSVESLKNNWYQWANQYVIPVQQRFNKPVVFAEIGYRSIDNAYQQPWKWDNWANYNPTPQANAYEAFFQFWSQYSFVKGVQLWHWLPNPNGGGQGDVDYTPQNKPAQDVMTSWFTSSTTNPPATGGGTSTGTKVRIGVQSPAHLSHVSGTLAFKAAMPYIAITKYQLYWQVDGGPLTLMDNNYNGTPHKEATVDVSDWNWNGTGTYRLGFIAKTSQGVILSEQAIKIYVDHQ